MVSREAFRVQIVASTDTVRSRLEESQTASSPLARARAMFQALEPAVERVDLVRRYQVVGGRTSSQVDGKSPQEISVEAERALAEVVVAVDARQSNLADGSSGAPSPQLRRIASETLTEMGLHVAADDEPGRDDAVELHLRLGLARVERGLDDWVFYRWEGSFRLVSNDDGVAFLAVATARGEESHTDAAVARARAVEKGRIALSQSLESRLSDYLYSASDSLDE